MAITFPNINPVIISFGPLAISWYSLSYLAGILIGWFLSSKIVKKFAINISAKNLEDFVSWEILGIVVGGRLGYVLLYDPIKYLSHPIDILKTYEGGMSFHGGMIGLCLAAYFFSLLFISSSPTITSITASNCSFCLVNGNKRQDKATFSLKILGS